MKNGKTLWQLYHVRIDFLTSLCASVPANPELITKWLDARKPRAQPPGRRSISEIQEEVVSSLAEQSEDEQRKFLLVFQRDNGQLVMRAATFRAHLKDCARVISSNYVGKIKGEKAFSTRFINCVYPDERLYWIPILNQNDGKAFVEPSGIREKAIHLWNGSALKAMEFVIGARMEIDLKVLGANIHQEDLETVLQYGGVHGYGGERGDGEGKYEFTLEKKSGL